MVVSLSGDKSEDVLESKIAEIRKLMERVRPAVPTGQNRFNPELDYRIRRQLESQHVRQDAREHGRG
jgi:hypothetical protein